MIAEAPEHGGADGAIDDKADSAYYVRVFVLGVAGVIVLWLVVTWLVLQFVAANLDDESLGAGALLGDAFGTVNALFSALAFVGVIVAILMQKRELQLQRKELKVTQDELRRSADAQTKSEQALTKQADSLLLAAYLNALNSLHECQQARAKAGKSRDSAEVLSSWAPRGVELRLENITVAMRPIVAQITASLGADDAGPYSVVYRAMSDLEQIREALDEVYHFEGYAEVQQSGLALAAPLMRSVTRLSDYLDELLSVTDPESLDLLRIDLRDWRERIAACRREFDEVSAKPPILSDDPDSYRHFRELVQSVAANLRGWIDGRWRELP